MQLLRKKLRSQQGTSILLALAVMLVCTMVASVVLVAAAANAGKGLSSQEQTRSFYAVSSAARLFADDVEAHVSFVDMSTTTKSYACQEVHPSYVHDDANQISEIDLTPIVSASTPFAQIMEDAVRAIDPADENSSYERTLTVNAPNLEAVDVNFVMDASYNVVVKFSCAPGSNSYGYGLTLTLPAILSEPTEEITRLAAADSHFDGWEWDEGGDEYSWLEENKTAINSATGNHEPAANEYGHSVEQFYDVVETKTSSQISWGQPTYSKGVGA